MKTLIKRTFALSLLAGAAVSMTGMACHQLPPRCTLGRGTFGVRLTYVAGSKTGSAGTCDQLAAMVFGASAYNPDDGSGYPDLMKGSAAVKSQEMADLEAKWSSAGVDPAADNVDYALGDFATSEAGGDGFCQIPSMKPALLDLPEIPAVAADPTDPTSMASPAVPAVKIQYQFSNFRVYVNADAIGTQFAADLTYTKNGCTANYKAWGVYGSNTVTCSVTDPDSGATTGANAELCSAVADPDAGIAFGSGIAPEATTACQQDRTDCAPPEAMDSTKPTCNYVCVPTKEPPAFL